MENKPHRRKEKSLFSVWKFIILKLNMWQLMRVCSLRYLFLSLIVTHDNASTIYVSKWLNRKLVSGFLSHFYPEQPPQNVAKRTTNGRNINFFTFRQAEKAQGWCCAKQWRHKFVSLIWALSLDVVIINVLLMNIFYKTLWHWCNIYISSASQTQLLLTLFHLSYTTQA